MKSVSCAHTVLTHRSSNRKGLAAVWGLVLVFLASCMNLPSARAEDDLQYWNLVGLRVKMTDRLSWRINQELWLVDDITQIGTTIVDTGLTWKAFDFLSLTPAFKYEHDRYAGGRHVNENRWFLDADFKTRIKDLKLSHRSRMEYRNRNTYDNWRYRLRFRADYPLPFEKLRITPYTFDEIFWDIHEGELNQNRFAAGISFPLHEHVSMSLYYLLKSNRRGADWDEAHILGTAVVISV